jgi:hypothetical protein
VIIPSSLNLFVVFLIPGEKLWVYFSTRQGSPISPYLFFITAEILGIAIRRSDDVKCFKYKNAESKLSQYADDTQIIIDGSENSIKTSINILNEFSKLSAIQS